MTIIITDVIEIPAIAPALRLLLLLLLLLSEGGLDGTTVGATVRMMIPLEVAFTNSFAPNFSALEVSCLLKKPFEVEASSWDCRSPRLYWDAKATTYRADMEEIAVVVDSKEKESRRRLEEVTLRISTFSGLTPVMQLAIVLFKVRE
jgi:hypothetical protein